MQRSASMSRLMAGTLEMTAYSSIYRHQDRTYMFYNGNNCGETGFGYAVLEEPEL